MSPSFYISLAALTFACLNLFISVFELIRCFRTNRISLLFWFSSLYVAGIPIFVDSFSFLIGKNQSWFDLLSQYDINYVYNYSSDVIFDTAAFVFCFNLLFLVINRVFTCKFVRKKQNFHMDYSKKVLVFADALFALTVISALLLFIIGYKPIFVTLLPVGAISVFVYVDREQYIKAIFSSLPHLMVAFLLSQRPLLLPIFAAFIFVYLKKNRIKLKYKKVKFVFTIFFVGILTVVIFDSVRLSRSEHIGIKNILCSAIYPINRDTSVNNMYYTFEDNFKQNKYQFSGLKTLITTGFVSLVVPKDDMVKSVDLTRKLAFLKFGWESGSLHPTLYGWAYYDMGWFGILFSFFVALFMGICEKISTRGFLSYGLSMCVSTIFIMVAMRGSVQFAYSRSIYSLILGFILISFIESRKRCKKLSSL